MAEDLPAPKVEIGRIVFRSWEHAWETGEWKVPSIASSKRTLPENLTRPIYEILHRKERYLRRSSLPFAPYGVRIRPANDWAAFATFEEHTREIVSPVSLIGDLCPNWDEDIARLFHSQPRVKYGKDGFPVRVPDGEDQLMAGYELDWVTVGTLLSQMSRLSRA